MIIAVGRLVARVRMICFNGNEPKAGGNGLF